MLLNMFILLLKYNEKLFYTLNYIIGLKRGKVLGVLILIFKNTDKVSNQIYPP